LVTFGVSVTTLSARVVGTPLALYILRCCRSMSTVLLGVTPDVFYRVSVGCVGRRPDQVHLVEARAGP